MINDTTLNEIRAISERNLINTFKLLAETAHCETIEEMIYNLTATFVATLPPKLREEYHEFAEEVFSFIGNTSFEDDEDLRSFLEEKYKEKYEGDGV